MQETEKVSSLHVQVGQRIKQRRKALNISQMKLAEMLNASYQQIQKYESGANQLTLSKMLQLSKIMNVEPSYFYQNLDVSTLENTVESDVIQKRTSWPLRILLVEDSPADALLFSKASEKFENEISIECISDTEKVMDHLYFKTTATGERRPDIILLDLSLPKISGLQLLKQIKGNSQTAIIPILIVTNSISKKEMHEAYRLGAAGFIQKSIHLNEYRDSVETMIHYWANVVALPVG